VSERGAAAGRLATVACALACACLAAAPAPQGLHKVALVSSNGPLRISNSQAGRAIVTARNMKPGETVAGTVTVANRGHGAAHLMLASSRARDRPGPRGGRLSERLAIKVAERPRRGRTARVVRAVAGCHAMGELVPGKPRTFTLTVQFARGEGDNAYAGSTASVDESWIAGPSGGCGAREVLAVHRGSGGRAASERPGSLPFTGFHVLLLAAIGAATLAAGLVLRRMDVRFDRPPS
jgi:spore coat-associated protein N